MVQITHRAFWFLGVVIQRFACGIMPLVLFYRSVKLVLRSLRNFQWFTSCSSHSERLAGVMLLRCNHLNQTLTKIEVVFVEGVSFILTSVDASSLSPMLWMVMGKSSSHTRVSMHPFSSRESHFSCPALLLTTWNQRNMKPTS